VTTEPGSVLAGRLGIELADPSLLELARVHPSYTAEHGTTSNQRLEFLGDAILGFVVAEALFLAHPEMGEGGMSKTRIALVNESVLADLARSLDLGSLLLVGRGAEAAGDREKDSVLADAMEAVFGAVYLTAGYEPVRSLVLRLLGDRLEEAAADPGSKDFKSLMNEWSHKEFGQLPCYEVTSSGPAHDPRFVATLKVADRVLGTGEGRSKKAAEADAARAAWEDHSA